MRPPLLALLFSAVFCNAGGQYFEPLKTALDKPLVHKAMIHISAYDNMSLYRPTIITKSGSTIMSRQGNLKTRNRLSGVFNIWYHPLPSHKTFQLHFFVEFGANETYGHSRYGFGYTKRDSRYSLGLFSGQYWRRVPQRGDLYRDGRSYQDGVLLGAYFAFDPRKEIAVFAAAGMEKSRLHHRLYVAVKVGEIICWKATSGFRIFAESETFLGMGAGVSWIHDSRIFGASLAYMYPDLEEARVQRMFGNRLERGLGIRLWVQMM